MEDLIIGTMFIVTVICYTVYKIDCNHVNKAKNNDYPIGGLQKQSEQGKALIPPGTRTVEYEPFTEEEKESLFGKDYKKGQLEKNESYKLRNQINKLESTLTDAQPLIDKYKKERKQNHWKQYNDWKRMYASKHGRCAQCHGEDLEIDTDYKNKADKYESWYVREIVDYPETARCKCNTCGEVIATWEFKEDE